MHLESRAKAPWVSGKKKKKKKGGETLEKLVGAFQPAITVQLFGEEKKSPGPAPWDRRLCFNAKMNDRPISDINKEQLSCARFFFFHFPTVKSFKNFSLLPLYLVLSTLLHFLKREPNYVVLDFFLWLIKSIYLTILLTFS